MEGSEAAPDAGFPAVEERASRVLLIKSPRTRSRIAANCAKSAFETGSAGEYRFRTIKPVPYPGRTPHIHVKLRKNDHELLTTQLYVQGHPLNERDRVLRAIRDPGQRAALMVAFSPSQEHQGELTARFDIVLGSTPGD